MRHSLYAIAILILSTISAAAVIGDAPIIDPHSQPVVMIVSNRSSLCTGTAIAPNLLLTAAHCVLPGADYKLLEFDANHQPLFRDLASIVRHPQFRLQTLLAHRATADVALVKRVQPSSAQPAILANADVRAVPGDRFVLRGYGVAIRDNGQTGGKLRAATLIATGQPGNLQLRLVDPAVHGKHTGLGACTGDSGAPVFAENDAVYGVVSWSTGTNGESGCGGLTGVTPLSLYRSWIVDAARRLGVSLAP